MYQRKQDDNETDSVTEDAVEANEVEVEKHKTSTKLPIIIAISIIVIIFLFLVSWLYNSNRATTTASPNKPTVSDVSTLTPAEVTDKIKADLDKKYELLDIDKNNSPEVNQASIRIEKRSPVYKSPGFDYFTDTADASSLDIMLGSAEGDLPTAVDKQLRTDIAKTYADFGMEKTESRGEVTNGNGTDVYIGKGLICTVESPESASSFNSAACGNLRSYSAVAKKYEPIAIKIPSLDEDTVLTGLKITDSRVAGYKTATLGQGEIDSGGGSVALLYKTPAGKWNYFTNTQMGLPCSKYNTTDLRNAYKGEVCFDSTNDQSTVE